MNMYTQESIPLFQEVLKQEQAKPQSPSSINIPPKPYNLSNDLDSLSNLLNKLYPENNADEKELAKARVILGEKGKQLKPEEIKDLISKVQYLIDSWLDEYEREIFKGVTLNELLSSKQL